MLKLSYWQEEKLKTNQKLSAQQIIIYRFPATYISYLHLYLFNPTPFAAAFLENPASSPYHRRRRCRSRRRRRHTRRSPVDAYTSHGGCGASSSRRAARAPPPPPPLHTGVAVVIVVVVVVVAGDNLVRCEPRDANIAQQKYIAYTLRYKRAQHLHDYYYERYIIHCPVCVCDERCDDYDVDDDRDCCNFLLLNCMWRGSFRFRDKSVCLLLLFFCVRWASMSNWFVFLSVWSVFFCDLNWNLGV